MAKERDNVKAAELSQIVRSGVMSRRWKGVGEREKHASQHKQWKIQKSSIRHDQLTNHDSLKTEREA
jgi:hypothetical protein